jgi:hypothetical protein
MTEVTSPKFMDNFNPLTPELNHSAQRCLPRFLLGILIYKELAARFLYKSLGVKRSLLFLLLAGRRLFRPRLPVPVS